MEFYQSGWFFRYQTNGIPSIWLIFENLVIEISKCSAPFHFEYELDWTAFLASGTPQQWISRKKTWKNDLKKIIFPYLKNNAFWRTTLISIFPFLHFCFHSLFLHSFSIPLIFFLSSNRNVYSGALFGQPCKNCRCESTVNFKKWFISVKTVPAPPVANQRRNTRKSGRGGSWASFLRKWKWT